MSINYDSHTPGTCWNDVLEHIMSLLLWAWFGPPEVRWFVPNFRFPEHLIVEHRVDAALLKDLPSTRSKQYSTANLPQT